MDNTIKKQIGYWLLGMMAVATPLLIEFLMTTPMSILWIAFFIGAWGVTDAFLLFLVRHLFGIPKDEVVDPAKPT